ncbi:methyltransferase domain-containing protein [Halobacillus litoralis]|uniref:methyltransferase domain-containing protein n=1 Tax=Halobacillus litoralis TaxID=45668 RepID=UPI001CD32D2B|nr:methyltransferase domain-containing protein [Halobacillus litoralis]MCA0970972.1 methyltransferase domain-containing protein [Halobacillus litoralis]
MAPNNDKINERYYGNINAEASHIAAQNRVHWMCKQAKGNKILDVGCSQGITSILLGREGFEVTGIDIEQESIDYALQELSKESETVKKNVNFSLQSVLEHNSLNKKYDTIILGEVLEHFSNPEKLLTPLYEMLNQDGVIVITVPFGYLRFHDHKQTFYVYNFMQTVLPYFAEIELSIQDKYIYFVGNKREQKVEFNISEVASVETLSSWLELEETYFLQIEKDSFQKQKNRKELLDKRKEEIRKLKKELIESPSVKHMNELEKMLKKYEDYFKELEDEQTNLSNTDSLQPLVEVAVEQKKKMDNIQNILLNRRSENQSVSSDDIKKYKNEIKKQKDLIRKKDKSLKNARQTVHNLSSNNNVRFHIGDAIIRSRRSLKDVIKLPFRLFKLYNKAKSGDLITKPKTSNTSSDSSNIQPIPSSGEGIIFVPTNGAGLGHLTRLLAIARRVRQIDPEREIIFFATSSAMHLILQEGFLGYHLPSKMLFPKDVSSTQWNNLLKDQLGTALELHRPNTLVFDGAFPYAGLISSMKQADDLERVWVRRGQHKKGKKEVSGDKERNFHKVIVPGEAGELSEELDSNKLHCNPVIYLDKNETLSKKDVRKMWGIPDDGFIIYVQLGAGNINDINSTLNKVLNLLSLRDDIYIVLGESVIGKRKNIFRDRLFVIRDYPNSRFYEAFDLAITAAGYNTYHELMYFGVPSIFIPNEDTKTDDQLSRAKKAEAAEAGIVVREPIEESVLRERVLSVMDPTLNEKMRRNAKKLVVENGADEIASYLIEQIKRR